MHSEMKYMLALLCEWRLKLELFVHYFRISSQRWEAEMTLLGVHTLLERSFV